MKVLCIDDSNMPPGANVEEGKVYVVESYFINSFDEKTYIIKGVVNQGRTRYDTPWRGYKASRFIPMDEHEVMIAQEQKFEPIFN